jgi:DNA processing protein
MVDQHGFATHNIRDLAAEEKVEWLRLARSGGIGPVLFQRLLRRLGCASAVLKALPGMIAAGTAPGVEICRRETAERELAAIAAMGGTLLAACEPAYPELLCAIPDPPPVLTLMGDAAALRRQTVAIVGARNASGNGRLFARALAAELAAAGLCVVSGLARGIDTAAHEGALSGAAGTVAVIASGVDVPYPDENAGLARRIAEGGAVVSERPLGAVPQARHFPRRNRIIAGLSLGVVVVEAAPGSGSLITARLAADQGREVMAVPGTPLDPRHKGTNQLLRDGASLVECAADVLALLRPLMSAPRRLAPTPCRALHADPPPAARPPCPELAPTVDGLVGPLGEWLGPEPMPIDELVRLSGLTVAAVHDALLDLELAGRLERHPGNRVALRLG